VTRRVRLQNMPWGKYCVWDSPVFRAACNEAVEPSMRPVRGRALCRLAGLFPQAYHEGSPVQKELWKMFNDLWQRALGDTPRGAREVSFARLLSEDMRWKNTVLDVVVRERSWIGLLNLLPPVVAGIFEKLRLPEHSVARRTVSGLVGLSLAISALQLPLIKHWVQGAVSVVFQPIQVQPVEVRLKAPEPFPHIPVTLLAPDSTGSGSAVKARLDPDELKLKLKLALEPTKADLEINPFIQYSSNKFGGTGSTSSPQFGVPVHFVPDGDIYLISKQSSDAKSSIPEISVRELRSPKENGETAPSKDGSPPPPELRPLDQIGGDLNSLTSQLQTSDLKFGLALLQQSHNQIESASLNQAQTEVQEVQANSTYSIVLQWVTEQGELKSCILALKIKTVTGSEVSLASPIDEKCSPGGTALHIPTDLSTLGAGSTTPLDPWLLSVDGIRQRWLFQHVARLRFTWQPAIQPKQPVAQAQSGTHVAKAPNLP
jgi:hypothetical protein